MKQKAPRCSVHVSRQMTYTGEAFKVSFAGKKIVWGWRFRCSVEGCHRVDLIEPKQPEPPVVKSPKMPDDMRKRLTRYPF